MDTVRLGCVQLFRRMEIVSAPESYLSSERPSRHCSSINTSDGTTASISCEIHCL
jgi:hypothetical protein